MLEDLLDKATYTQDEQERVGLIREMAESPDEMLTIALKALRQPPVIRQAVAIQVLRAIGYPLNASAISELLYHVGDPNLPGWDEAVKALVEMGPDAVVPHLVKLLLERGHTDQYWSSNVEGLCVMLSQVENIYAVRCCPAINYLLSREQNDPDEEMLFGVIEKAEVKEASMLPMFITLADRYKNRDLAKRVKKLIAAFSYEDKEPYRLLLLELEETTPDSEVR